MLTRLVVTLCALNLSLLAQSTPEPSADTTEPLTDTGALAAAIKLHLARNGQEVLIAWEVPDASIKGVDIYRNSENRTPGRVRLKFARPTPSRYTDTVPDAKATYWYWIKVVFKDSPPVNIGPLATPPSEVWEP